MLVLFALPAALAGAPIELSEPRTLDDEFIEIRAQIAAPVEAVKAVLNDSARSAELPPDAISARVVSKQGGCDRVNVVSERMGYTMDITFDRCAIAGGWTESLIESDSLSEFSSRLEIAPSGEGTALTYRMKTTLDLPVPKWMTAPALRGSMRGTLEALAAQVELD